MRVTVINNKHDHANDYTKLEPSLKVFKYPFNKQKHLRVHNSSVCRSICMKSMFRTSTLDADHMDQIYYNLSKCLEVFAKGLGINKSTNNHLVTPNFVRVYK